MEIKLENKVFDGKWQWVYFLILDVNDLLGCLFTFVVGNGNTFQNFNVDVTGWDKESTKYKLCQMLQEEIERRTILEVE